MEAEPRHEGPLEEVTVKIIAHCAKKETAQALIRNIQRLRPEGWPHIFRYHDGKVIVEETCRDVPFAWYQGFAAWFIAQRTGNEA
jgi:hypothetical protein